MNELSELAERITVRYEGRVVLQPCLDVTLYWAGDPFAIAAGLVAFQRKAFEVLGGQFRYFRTETMTAAKPLKKDTLDLLPFWLQKTQTRRDVYMLFLENGAQPDEPSDRAFGFNAAPGMGYIRLILPVSFHEGDPAAFLDLALGLGATIPYDFGQAGLAVNWNPLSDDDERAVQAMHAIGNRYPGIDMSNPSGTKYIVTKGIKCINWLTFLNPGQIERLGGFAQIEGRLEQSLVLHRLPSGAALQAGAEPQAGDVNRKLTLPAYHAAGRLVASLRSKEHPAILGPDGFSDEDATSAWLARFDR